MWHGARLDREFFARLLAIDTALAARTRASRCGVCGGPLCASHFERKPRGGLLAAAGEDPAFRRRYSYCCAREGCRKRATPPSVRFLGRKVYLEGAILIACVIAPLVHEHARAVREATGIAARTVRRWQQWWRTTFTASALWVELRSRRPLDPSSLPGAMLDLFDGESRDDRLCRATQWLSPLTSVTAQRSRGSRDIM